MVIKDAFGTALADGDNVILVKVGGHTSTLRHLLVVSSFVYLLISPVSPLSLISPSRLYLSLIAGVVVSWSELSEGSLLARLVLHTHTHTAVHP